MEAEKQCLVITAYKSVEMLRCLLETVHEKFWCYVHVDKRKWEKFEGLQNEFTDVYFMSKYNVNWGGMSTFWQFWNCLTCVCNENLIMYI